MTIHYVMWAGLMLTLVGAGLACFEWYRGRGAGQLPSSLVGILVFTTQIVGPEHFWLSGLTAVVAVGFLVYTIATFPHRVPLQSVPGILMVLLFVLFAMMVALPNDAPRGILTAIFYALIAVLLVTGGAVSWMLYKAMIRARAVNR